MVTINKKQTSVLALVAIFAAIMVVGPVATNSAFASDNHHGKNFKKFFERDNNNCANRADQSIDQDQSSEQSSFVVSGDDTSFSGNNFNEQDQFNFGNNALGQQCNSD